MPAEFQFPGRESHQNSPHVLCAPRSPHAGQILIQFLLILFPRSALGHEHHPVRNRESISGSLTYMIVFLAFTIGTGANRRSNSRRGWVRSHGGGVRCPERLVIGAGYRVTAAGLRHHRITQGGSAQMTNMPGCHGRWRCPCDVGRPFYGTDSGQSRWHGRGLRTIRSAVALRAPAGDDLNAVLHVLQREHGLFS